MFTLLLIPQAHAQDAYAYNEVSFVSGETGFGARALGMGGAYIGVADDYSALYWNPAGLGQLKSNEFYFSLTHNVNNIDTRFLGSALDNSFSKTAIGSIGLAYAVDVYQGSLVFAGGYNRLQNYNSLFGYSAFNTGASYIGYIFDEPYVPHSLNQEESIETDGSLSQYSFGFSIEAAAGVFVGAAFNYYSGNRDFDQLYIETDTQDLYTVWPDDFDQYYQENIYNKDIRGYDFKFGVMYRYNQNVRLGMTINTPRKIDFEEDWVFNEDITFDNGDIDYLEDSDDFGKVEYDLKMPFVFGFGLSYDLANFLISGEVQLTDWTQMKYEGESPFSDASTSELNRNIRQTLRSTVNSKIGAEYRLPQRKLALRFGYSYEQNPLENAISSSNRKYISGGVGIQLGNDAVFDISYRRGWWETESVGDFNGIAVDEDHVDNKVLASLVYRFK